LDTDLAVAGHDAVRADGGPAPPARHDRRARRRGRAVRPSRALPAGVARGRAGDADRPGGLSARDVLAGVPRLLRRLDLVDGAQGSRPARRVRRRRGARVGDLVPAVRAVRLLGGVVDDAGDRRARDEGVLVVSPKEPIPSVWEGLPVVDAAAMRALDFDATARFGIPAADLMENAGRAVAEATAAFLKEKGVEPARA